jgi:hypothetical protein
MIIPIKEVVERHFKAHMIPGDQLLSNLDKEQLLEELFGVFKQFQLKLNPKEPWLDKTPHLPMMGAAPILARLWPTAVFVFAKRRGIETVISRTKKFPAATFEQHCTAWSRFMASWRSFRDTGINGMEIDQYDVAHDPARSAARLGSFLGVAEAGIRGMCEEMLHSRPESTDEHSTHRVLSLDACGWTAQQVEFFQTQCSGEMAAYGYTFDERYRVPLAS